MRVTIGSPIYERPEPAFVTSLIATLDLLHARGHEADWRYASAVVHYARNYLMADMLRHEPDVLVQIDADHQWDAIDVVDAIETVYEEYADVIGFAHIDRKPTNALAVQWCSPIVRGAVRSEFVREDKRYIEVDAVGGGILVCSRSCIERMSENATHQPLGDAPVLFDYQGDQGEDVFFCNRWREMNGKIHCDMTSLIGHIGRRVYAMNPAQLLTELEFEKT